MILRSISQTYMTIVLQRKMIGYVYPYLILYFYLSLLQKQLMLIHMHRLPIFVEKTKNYTNLKINLFFFVYISLSNIVSKIWFSIGISSCLDMDLGPTVLLNGYR